MLCGLRGVQMEVGRQDLGANEAYCDDSYGEQHGAHDGAWRWTMDSARLECSASDEDDTRAPCTADPSGLPEGRARSRQEQ